MTATRTTDAEESAEVLVNATTAAAQAPSVHDIRPWRWRHGDNRIDLFIQDSRILDRVDPAHRLAVLSCGAALHHALVSLAADGRQATVSRLPDAADPRHLATVRAGAGIPVEAGAIRRLQTIALRHETHRRPALSSSVDADKLRSIVAAAGPEGATVHLLRPRQVLDLAAAADRIHNAEAGETSGPAARTTASGRRFGYPGIMDVNDTHNRAAAYAVLHGPADDDLGWLRAGEALSAVWLTATELDISVLPLSETIEVVAMREAVRQLLADGSYPYLVLRFGAIGPVAPGSTPRSL